MSKTPSLHLISGPYPTIKAIETRLNLKDENIGWSKHLVAIKDGRGH